VGRLRHPLGSLESPLQLGLALGVDLHGDVPEWRRGQVGVELRLVGRVGELEEGERAAVGEVEERVAVDAQSPEQLVGFRPRRSSGKPSTSS